MSVLGGCRERCGEGGEQDPLLPNSNRFPAPTLPAPSCSLSRGPGTLTEILASGNQPGPTGSQAHTREKMESPSCLSGVALRLRAPAPREHWCQLGCSHFCW